MPHSIKQALSYGTEMDGKTFSEGKFVSEKGREDT